jgi:sugar/nucleoside kinase (ribokinase family)
MLHRKKFDELHQAANGQDVLHLFTPQLLTDISRDLIELGVKIVCIKLGHRGFYLHTADLEKIDQLGRARPSRPERWVNKQIWAPAFRVEEVGATGAGDASIAGFLGAFLRDLSPEEAITAATAVGACNVEAADGVSGIRPWQETVDRVAAGWSRRELDLDAPGWQFDQNRQLWVGPA